MKKAFEPEILFFYRFFTVLCSFYFLGIYTFQEVTLGNPPLLRLQALICLGVSVLLTIFFTIPFFAHRLGTNLIPVGLTIHMIGVVAALAVNFFVPGLGIVQMLNSIWALTPVWLVILIIIAWQYSFFWVLVFAISVHVSELALIYYILQKLSLTNIQYLGFPFVNTFAFIFAGRMISDLHKVQREQHDALSIANEKLKLYAESLEDLSVSRERNRIARELHDTISHTLSGTAINLEAVKRVIHKDPDKAQAMLEQSLFVVRNGLDDTRRAMYDLRAKPLEEEGLLIALRQSLETLRERERLQVQIEMPEVLPSLPASVEHAFYRIEQEAIENVIRHAAATKVDFSLSYSGRTLSMRIADDGKGFSPAISKQETHFGIVGMRERANTINASFAITSKPQGGTLISLDWKQE